MYTTTAPGIVVPEADSPPLKLPAVALRAMADMMAQLRSPLLFHLR